MYFECFHLNDTTIENNCHADLRPAFHIFVNSSTSLDITDYVLGCILF